MEMQWATKMPEAWRLLRINLGRGQAYMAAATGLLFSLLVIAVCVGKRVFVQLDPELNAIAGDVFVALTILHYICYLVAFPGACALAMYTDWRNGAWLFQKTTPLSSSQLVAGKLLGAPSVFMIGAAVSFPFFFLSSTLAGISILRFLFSYLMLVLIGLTGGGAAIYLSVFDEGKKRTKHQGYEAIPLVLGGIIVMIMIAAVLSSEESETPARLLFALGGYFYHGAIPTVHFFSCRLSTLIVAPVIYLALLGWFIHAASAQLGHRMYLVRSRLPLIGLQVTVIFILLGLFFGRFHMTREESRAALDPTFLVFFPYLSMIIFIYATMAIHNRAASDLRPWFYRLMEPGAVKPGYWFRMDAPFLFTLIPLLLIAAVSIIGFDRLMMHYDFYPLIGRFGGKEAQAPQLWRPHAVAAGLMFVCVALRDYLLFQTYTLTAKKYQGWLLLAYLFFVGVVPYLADYYLMEWRYDLTVLGALGAFVTPAPLHRTASILGSFATLLLAAGLAWWSFRRTLRRFVPEEPMAAGPASSTNQ